MKPSRHQALENLLAEAAASDVTIHLDAEAEALLDWLAVQKNIAPEKVQAVTFGSDIFVRQALSENVRVLREELIHVAQQRAGIAVNEITEAEIDARLQMIRDRRGWSITNDETRELIDEVRKIKRKGEY